jgi:hypothetical protein
VPYGQTGMRAVIPFDVFCSNTLSCFTNLLVEENCHPSFLLAVSWPLMEILSCPKVIDYLYPHPSPSFIFTTWSCDNVILFDSLLVVPVVPAVQVVKRLGLSLLLSIF